MSLRKLYYLSSVAGKLKNLFLLFAGHIVKNVSSLLKAIHEEKQGEDLSNIEL